MRLSELWAKLRRNWFLSSLVFLILFAKLIPDIGKKGGLLRPEYTVKYAAVSFIFFNSGLLLRTEDLSAALLHWRLHLFIQGFTLGLVPVLMYGLCGVLRWSDIDPELITGLQVVGCMPPPVSSAVILTKAAGGNEAGAIFNSAFGSFLGIFITPVLLLRYLGSQADVDPADVVNQLTATVVFPLIAGQIVRTQVKPWLRTTTVPFNDISSCVLLLIIFTTFCDTFSRDDMDVDSLSLIQVALIVIILQCLMLVFTFWVSTIRCLGFSPADSTAIMYCSTHKSLTLGVPMLKILFSGDHNLSVFTIPLLMYHPIQIVLGGLLVPTVKRWLTEENKRWDVQGTSEV